MKPFIVFVVVLALHLVRVNGKAEPKFPNGDVRNCPITSPQDPARSLYQMEVLPGGGFDNLHSVDMGQVLNYNYSLCLTSKDGKYLIPDNVLVIPLKRSRFTTSAEYFDHWNNYTMTTALSMGLGLGIKGLISAKFSTEFKNVKSRMYNDNAKMTRSQVRSKIYTIKIQPDSPLNPVFKVRLFDIAAYLQRNDVKQARYLAELVVRDFGTHCITSLEAGALIVQTSYLKSSYIEQYSDNSFKFSLTQTASVVFDDVVINESSRFKVSTDQSHINSFLSNRIHSEFDTIGGPMFQANFSLSDWEAGIADSLVATDRSGVPLDTIITPNSLPELHPLTTQMVSDVIREVIDRYYRINTRPGCTNPRAKDFDFHANIDNGLCDYPSNNYTFGGIYQVCEVDQKENYEDLCTVGPQASQPNPLTGGFSCPTGYTPVKIHSGSITHVSKHIPHQECHSYWYTLGIPVCKTVYGPLYSTVHYIAYWCAALPGTEIPNNSGYLFGGLFTSLSTNPVTNTNECPPFFIQLHMGEDIRVCVSDDYERGYARSIAFAGFQSCTSGNPLAASQNTINSNAWPHECPLGYAQHLVSVDDGCEINYCVKMGAFTSQSVFPAHLPPFHKQPRYIKKNGSQPLTLAGVDKFWIKNSEGHWVPEPPIQSIAPDEIITTDKSTHNQDTSTQQTIAPTDSVANAEKPDVTYWLPSICFGIILVLFIAGVIIYIIWRRKKASNNGEHQQLIEKRTNK